MKKLFTGLLIPFLFLFFFNCVKAHPGNTASDGCHYCRTNCDKWGVPWNQRHCHGGSTVAPTPKPVKTDPVAPKTTEPIVASPVAQIKSEIIKSKTDYFLNPDGFREILINDLVSKFPNAIASTIGSNVYKLLPDVVCNINKFNCTDFATHNEAQSVYEKCMKEVEKDIHSLDADDDGEACESNK